MEKGCRIMENHRPRDLLTSEVPQAVFWGPKGAQGNQDLGVFRCFRIYLATYCLVDDNVLMGVV